MIDPNLITTISTGELPPLPITLDSLLAHEITGDLYRSTVNELLQFLRPLVGKLQFEVIEMDVNNQYVIDNFDSTGLGKNLCLGFAICNGNNGTKDRDGRTAIAYGTTYNFMGAFGGATTHTLTVAQMPVHSHSMNGSVNTTGGSGQNVVNNTTDNTGDVITKTEGGGLPHNNMQPYIVTLVMMKL